MHVVFDLTILHMFPASSSLLYREHVIFAFTFFQTLIMITVTIIHMMADQAIFAKFSAPDPTALQELRRGPCCTTSSVQRTVHVALPLPRHTASAPRKQPFRHCTVSKDLGCIRLLGISKTSNHSWARDQGLQQGSARKDGLTKHKDAAKNFKNRTTKMMSFSRFDQHSMSSRIKVCQGWNRKTVRNRRRMIKEAKHDKTWQNNNAFAEDS